MNRSETTYQKKNISETSQLPINVTDILQDNSNSEGTICMYYEAYSYKWNTHLVFGSAKNWFWKWTWMCDKPTYEQFCGPKACFCGPGHLAISQYRHFHKPASPFVCLSTLTVTFASLVVSLSVAHDPLLNTHPQVCTWLLWKRFRL